MALLPVVGASLIIVSGPGAYVNRVLFSHRLVVLIGLVSYPLYLWHWPLLAFTNAMNDDEPLFGVRLSIILISFLLALLTYRFVEAPFRNGKNLTYKAGISIAALVIVGIGGGALFIFERSNLSSDEISRVRRPPTWPQILAEYSKECPFKVGSYKGCYLIDKYSTPDVLLIGDSHSGQLIPGILKYKPNNVNFGAFILNGSCPPLYGIKKLTQGISQN